MKALSSFLAALLAAGALLAQPVDRNKLKPLHDAGKAFEKGLDDPSASVEEVRDLRQKLDREAAVSAGGAATPEEKRLVETYTAAAREYEDARNRFDRDKSRDQFFKDLHRIQAELKEADDLFNGTAKASPAPAEVPPPPAAPKKAPPAAVAPPPVLAPPPPVKSTPPPPVAAPPPPPVVVPPPPAVVPPPVVVPPPPVIVPPPPIVVPPPVIAPPPSPAAPAPAEAPPPPKKTLPAAVAPPPPPEPVPPPPVAPPPAPTATAPREEAGPPAAEPTPPREALSLNDFRKAANRVKIDKDSAAVSRCSRLAEFTVANSGSGVYEIAGHNFYYGNAQELIRLKTAEAGGDRFVIRTKTKSEISGEAYRCGK